MIFSIDRKILLTTKQGQMKQVNLQILKFQGIIDRYAMKLSKDDELVSVDYNQLDNIVAISKHGYVS